MLCASHNTMPHSGNNTIFKQACSSLAAYPKPCVWCIGTCILPALCPSRYVSNAYSDACLVAARTGALFSTTGKQLSAYPEPSICGLGGRDVLRRSLRSFSLLISVPSSRCWLDDDSTHARAPGAHGTVGNLVEQTRGTGRRTGCYSPLHALLPTGHNTSCTQGPHGRALA